MVALHLDHAVLHRAAAATRGLELFAQLLQRGLVHQHTLDQGDRLAATPFGLARYAHDAVARGQRFVLLAHALRHRLPAGGAHAA